MELMKAVDETIPTNGPKDKPFLMPVEDVSLFWKKFVDNWKVKQA